MHTNHISNHSVSFFRHSSQSNTLLNRLNDSFPRAEVQKQIPTLLKDTSRRTNIPPGFFTHKTGIWETVSSLQNELQVSSALRGPIWAGHRPTGPHAMCGDVRRACSPQGCSPHGSPHGQCHPAGAESCTLSLCRRSCPQCTQPRARPGGCGTWEGCSHPSGPVRTSSSGLGSGKRLCHCRTRGHPLPN